MAVVFNREVPRSLTPEGLRERQPEVSPVIMASKNL